MSCSQIGKPLANQNYITKSQIFLFLVLLTSSNFLYSGWTWTWTWTWTTRGVSDDIERNEKEREKKNLSMQCKLWSLPVCNYRAVLKKVEINKRWKRRSEKVDDDEVGDDEDGGWWWLLCGFSIGDEESHRLNMGAWEDLGCGTHKPRTPYPEGSWREDDKDTKLGS